MDFKNFLEEIENVKKQMIKEFEKIDTKNDFNIKKLSDNPYVFTVSFGTICQNNFILSPEYYETSRQKEKLIEIIKKSSSPQAAVEKIKKIIKTKEFPDNSVISDNLVKAAKDFLIQINAD